MNIGSVLKAFGGSSGAALARKQEDQSVQSDVNQQRQIGAQMDSENKKTQAQIRQIQQETKTKVAEMYRESNLNRAKSASKLHSKWVQQIMA